MTFPLIAPAIISGMLLSFIVMLGIYGIPAVLGTPADIPVLTTYIFKLTNWSPPLYSTAASVAIILMVVTGFLVWLQQKVMSRAQLHHGRRQGVPARRCSSSGRWRYFTLGARGRLSVRRRGAADAGADRRGVPQVPVHPQRREPVRHERQYSLIHFERLFANPLALRSIVNTMEVGFITALVGGVLAFAIGYTVNRTQRCRAAGAST